MNVGVIGCGHIAGIHTMAYKNMENVNIMGVSDIDVQKAKAFTEQYGIDKYFTDYMDLLEIKDLDLVDICTPTSTHVSLVCDAAKFSHNILVEKPMALSTAECEKMIQETKKHGSKLCVVHNQLFLQSIKRAKSLVDSGDYDLTSFTTSLKGSYEWLRSHNLVRSWNIAPEQKGIIWEVGTHHAYLQLHFLPNIKEVYAVGSKVKYPVYDDFTVLLRTSDNRYGIMAISWVTKEADVVYEICSSDGKRLQIYEDYDFLLEKLQDYPDGVLDVARSFYTDEKRIFRKWTKFGMNFIRKGKTHSHFELINGYIESLEKDSDPPVTPEQGKKTIRLLECIEESLNTHRAVEVNF